MKVEGHCRRREKIDGSRDRWEDEEVIYKVHLLENLKKNSKNE